MGDIFIEDPNSSFTFEAKHALQDSFDKLFEFFQKNILCDITIKTGEKSIKCHRIVLASCSPYFLSMFTSPLLESNESEIAIGDIEEAAMEMLIKFAYTAKIEITVLNAQSLLHASSVLQLDILAQACCKFMNLQLHPNNCLGIRHFADQHGYSSLVQKADLFTKLHFCEVAKNEDFVELSPSHLLELISSNDLSVDNEEQVFESVMQWVKHDIHRRQQYLPQLFSKIRLPFLTLSYLRQQVESHELVHSILKCRDYLDEAKDYQLWHASLLPAAHLPVNERTVPRKSYAGLLFCVGGRGLCGNPFSSVECYSWFHNKWFQQPDMSVCRRHVGCTAVKGKIYAVGGCDEKDHLSSAEVFDPSTNSWKSLSPMSTPRRGLGLCALDEAIYAIGGLDNNDSYYSTVERYDIDCDKWSSVAPMNCARGGVSVVTYKGWIYAVGGSNGPSSLNTCEVYFPSLNKWSFLPSLNQRRAGAGIATLNGYIYVIGGFENNVPLNSVEKYDPEENKWSYVAPMHTCRGGIAAATLGGKIYVVGGHNGKNYLCTVEAYNTSNDKWEMITEISQCRAGAGVVWIPCSKSMLNTLCDSNKVKCEPE